MGFFAATGWGCAGAGDEEEMDIPAKSAKSFLLENPAGAGGAAGGFEMKANPEDAMGAGAGVGAGAAAGGAAMKPNAELLGAGAGVWTLLKSA